MKESFLKFLAVGAVATLIQYLLLVLLVDHADMSPVVASTLGFLVSSLFNYYGNYRFTFASSQSHRIALTRFYSMLAIGLVINSVSMALLVHAYYFNYLLSQLLTTAILIVYFFCVSWLWVYKPQE